MRNFIIVGHRAVTDSNFSLNDLPGSGGRMDILARCINAAFHLSHNIRHEVEVAILLLGPEKPPKTIRFIGSELKYLNPDERSTGALIRNALIKQSTSNSESNIDRSLKKVTTPQSDGFPGLELRSSPGVYISNIGLSELIEYYSAKSSIIYLKETESDIHHSGTDIIEDDNELTFILSDHMDFTADEEKLIREHSKLEFSIGPEILHTDHCIILVHNFLDKLK